MRKLARTLGKDHALALRLWETGIPDAMIVASMIDCPGEVTPVQMDAWAADFSSWDVCDQVCMNLFDKTPHAWEKVHEWSRREEEFVRRAAFALIACLAWHDKKTPDDAFLAFLPIIREAAADERNYVKKAVNWALRHIGKRSAGLNGAAIEAAREIGKLKEKSARWIASDALRELTGEKVQKRLR
jgi:3-methyladenine DNA glycosylase AlkD